MKKHFLLTMLAITAGFTAFSQVDIDRSINLSNANPADAKITGIKQVNTAQDAVSAEVAQKGSLIYAVAGGTASVYTVTLTPAITAYTDGMEIRFKAPVNNAAAVQLNVNSVGAKTIKKNVSVNLAANDIVTGQLVSVIYDASADAFQMSSRIEQLSNTTTPGTYNNVTVNGQGLVTGGSNVAYLAGNQNIALSGDVSGSGTTAITTTISTNAVTTGKILDGTIGTADLGDNQVSNAKLSDVAQNTIKGRVSAGTGDPEDLSPAQVKSMLGLSNGVNGAGTLNYVRG